MNKIFPFPFFAFLRIVLKCGGLSGKGFLRALQWVVKTILTEPLRWIELATKSKMIREHTINQPPVFILGYYRSGTTYLQEMFRQDDRLSYMSAFQTVFPEIMLTGEKWLTPLLELFAGLIKQRNVFHRIPFTWSSNGEEDVALTTGMSSLSAQWGYLFPEKLTEYFEKYVMFENIPASEMQEWIKRYLLLLKKISLANNGKQLVLKNPPNTARIKLLLSLFPDAVFIFVRRNPYDVFASNKRLLKILQDNYCLGRVRSVDHRKTIFHTYSRLMQRYLQEKDLIRPGNLLEIEYEDLLKDPVATMKLIYRSLQIGNFDYCEKKISAYALLQKQYIVLQHQLPEEEVTLISEKWESVIRQMGYPVL